MPNSKVVIKLIIELFLSADIIMWWVRVTVAPELNKIAVFNNGVANGFIGITPFGGHMQPNSGVGAKLLWKYAQKKAKKNIISDVINNNMPICMPFITFDVW